VDSLECVANEVGAREEIFWDDHVPDLECCLRQYEFGPDPNAKTMLDAVARGSGAPR
jgi:hypothetical protein